MKLPEQLLSNIIFSSREETVIADSKPDHPIFSSFVITSGVKSNISYKVRQDLKDISHANNLEIVTKTMFDRGLIMIQSLLLHFKLKMGLNFTLLIKIIHSQHFIKHFFTTYMIQPIFIAPMSLSVLDIPVLPVLLIPTIHQLILRTNYIQHLKLPSGFVFLVFYLQLLRQNFNGRDCISDSFSNPKAT